MESGRRAVPEDAKGNSHLPHTEQRDKLGKFAAEICTKYHKKETMFQEVIQKLGLADAVPEAKKRLGSTKS